jgi:GT2 family glycosyltransferase
MLDLSIIVVNFNTRQLLDDCLQSLYRADTPPGGTEIIVVDNASSDGSQEMIREKHPPVQLICSLENQGFAAANNRGLAVARGAHILFLNSDTRVSPKALVQPLDYLKAHPEVGAITVKLVYPNGQRDPDNHRGFPTPWNAFCHFTGLGRLFPHDPNLNGYFASYKDFSQIHQVEVTAGSFMMMPADLCHRLNGWDESYFFYGEDIDFSYRINQAGYQIIYYPLVSVLHYKGASSGLRKESAKLAQPPKETRIKVARESVKSMKIFYQKFYRNKYPQLVTRIVLAGIQLRGWFRVVRHKLT